MNGHQVTYKNNIVKCVDIKDGRRRRGGRLDVRLDT
jgi:hypothetical protein